jgi:hypothetical protein
MFGGDFVTLLIIAAIVLFARNYEKRNKTMTSTVTPNVVEPTDPERAVRVKIASELQARSESLPDGDRLIWLAAARAVLSPAESMVAAQTVVSVAPPSEQPAPGPTFNWHSLENINILLFLGAFLVVVSAGIFVGYNYETLSGWLKFLLVASMAAAFYASGLAIYVRSKVMRPAGSAFTAIGLVTLPLAGLSYYNFVSQASASSVWFVTSVVLMACYAVALVLTRQTYIAYLTAFTSLSIYESGIAMMNLPVYWYGWGMSLTAIFLLVASRGRWWRDNEAESLNMSANIFLPIALVLSVAMISESGLGQLSGNFGLAAVFYALITWLRRSEEEAPALWLFTLVCLPISLTAGLWDHVDRPSVAFWLLTLTLGYLLVELAVPKLAKSWRQALGIVSCLLPLAASIIIFDHASLLVWCFGAATFAGAGFASRLKSPAFAAFAAFASLPIPFIVLRQVPATPLSWTAVAFAYLALAIALVGIKHIIRTWSATAADTGRAIYIFALLVALGTAWAAGPRTMMAVSLAMAALALFLRYYERSVAGVVAATALTYLALAQLSAIFLLGPEAESSIWFLAGVAFYLVGLRRGLTDEDAKALRYGGIIGVAVTAFRGSGFDPSVLPVVALSAVGLLVIAESMKEKQKSGSEIGVGIMVVSLNWLVAKQSIDQTQLYTIPWAIFAAYLAYRHRNDGKDTKDFLTGVALAVLTLPIAAQALALDGQLYGLELIAVSLGLVWLGATIRYRLISLWGAGALVAEVLYQMRDIIFAIPKYLISALIGVALLALAVNLLRRKKS